MEPSELDNVLVKFKYLWHAGLKAKLSVESHAGQAWVVLQAGLGHAPQPPVPWPHQRRNRNGPAQQWRRARCEAAQKVAANNMETQTEEHLKNNIEVAEEVSKISDNSDQKNGSEVKKHAPRILDDEILVERIIITPDCQSDWREPVVKKLVDEKLATIGLNSLRLKVNGRMEDLFLVKLILNQ